MKISSWIPSGIHVPPSAKRDILLLPALFVANCLIFSAWLYLGEVTTRPWLLLVWLYGLVGLVPLAWRDKAPVAVFAAQWALTVAAWPIMYYYIPIAGIIVALYTVAAHRDRRASLLALLVSCIPIGLALASDFGHHGSNNQYAVLFTNGALIVVAAGSAWGLGRVTQANQRRVQDLERDREAAREAEMLATERRRIARELHDIVSHAVTGIVFQAAGAARVADTDSTQVRQALGHIETTGRQTMAELRRLVEVLETSDPGGHAPNSGKFRPQPGLADLPELLTTLHDAGMPLAAQIEGTPRNLDQSVDLAAYRIVQEGLVNVVKHAGRNSNPRLRLSWETDSLRIQIDNDINVAQARRGQALSVGRGLVGLRERTHAAGGRLHAGPHLNGGYRLTATLPLATPEVSSVPCPSSQDRMDQGEMPA